MPKEAQIPLGGAPVPPVQSGQAPPDVVTRDLYEAFRQKNVAVASLRLDREMERLEGKGGDGGGDLRMSLWMQERLAEQGRWINYLEGRINQLQNALLALMNDLGRHYMMSHRIWRPDLQASPLQAAFAQPPPAPPAPPPPPTRAGMSVGRGA